MEMVEEYTPLILFVLLVAILWLVGTYNNFIKRRNMIEEQWSGIDVALRRRYNLIPNLIKAVKGYGKHESELLQQTTEQRVSGGDVDQRAASESEISRSLNNLLAVAEQYPDLKASNNFLALQNSLNEIEKEVQEARRRYNAAVRKFNTLVESFPSNIMARIFNFKTFHYFTLELATQRELPEVDF